MSDGSDTHTPTKLKREIGLFLLILYGLGITIGAGIYVLVGSAATLAGFYAPSAFLFAAIVMAFTALSFSELAGRVPQSAGEAVYVDAGFKKDWLTLSVGMVLILAATVAGAAISVGAAGYIAELVQLPIWLLAVFVILVMGAIAMRGVKEAVVLAGALTIIEVLGLVAIIVSGFWTLPDLTVKLPSAFPAFSDGAALRGVFLASLIAFFAFIGFDDVVNMVEETKNPTRTMPLAIILSLVIVTVIYFLVSYVAVQALGPEELSDAKAPISLLFERLTGLSPLAITLIAIGATINGVLIEILMASRVLFGLARKGKLPSVFAQISKATVIPLNATIFITLTMLVFAVLVPLDALVELTSQLILLAHMIVNFALVRIKLRRDPAPDEIMIVPLFVPILGGLTCLMLLVGPLFIG